MKISELAEIDPTIERDFVHFGVGPFGKHGPPSSSPLDIFSGPHSAGLWLDTISDAEKLATIIRIAIKVSFALDPNEPIAALRLIPNLIGPDAFGGSDQLQKLNEWITTATNKQS